MCYTFCPLCLSVFVLSFQTIHEYRVDIYLIFFFVNQSLRHLFYSFLFFLVLFVFVLFSYVFCLCYLIMFLVCVFFLWSLFLCSLFVFLRCLFVFCACITKRIQTIVINCTFTVSMFTFFFTCISSPRK